MMVAAALLVLEGLPAAFASEDLWMLCRPFGVVRSANVLAVANPRHPTQVGFVEMATIQEARGLAQELDGREFGSGMLAVVLFPY
jgi:hypothetical protein